MDFQTVSQLAALLSRSFAADFLRLLLMYKTISASEAASRLNLHIKTAQDFLQGLESLGIVSKKEVFEKKRPYFRYTLIEERIRIEIDLKQLKDIPEQNQGLATILIKEKKNANCSFKTSPRGDILSSVTLFTGKGRNREEQKISLTENQGKFLYYLPFPTEEPKSIQSLLKKAAIDDAYIGEILDIVYFLRDHTVIEMVRTK